MLVLIVEVIWTELREQIFKEDKVLGEECVEVCY